MNTEKTCSNETLAPASRADVPSTCTRDLPVWTPRTDVYETADNMMVVMDLPGVAKDTLHIELENRNLRIAGDVTAPVADGMTQLRQEIRGRRYARTFRLSDRIDAEKLNAQLANGVLTVTLPFTVAAKPRKIEISE